jgi:hypothetical protein
VVTKFGSVGSTIRVSLVQNVLCISFVVSRSFRWLLDFLENVCIPGLSLCHRHPASLVSE